MIPLLFFATVAQFNGTWVHQVDGRSLLVLTLEGKAGKIVRPEHFNVDSDGEISQIRGKTTEIPVKFTQKRGEMRVGRDLYRLKAVDPEHLDLAPAEVPWLALRLRRARTGDDLAVPSTWPEPSYAPEIIELQRQIQAMVEADQAVRLKDKVSAAEMDEVDLRHRVEVERIFERYGWPKRSIVGKEAAHQFWLLAQHQPLEVQQRMLHEMEVAAGQGEASRADYAYLYDRVQTRQGKPQRWGTQARCVNGLPVLFPVEDEAGLEERRRELRMPPMAVYLKQMRDMCRAMR
jgi:hypothetical protein